MPHAEVPEGLLDYFGRTSIALALGTAGEDNPLLFVNHGFTALTGYRESDAVGRNCRFLQGNADNAEARRRIQAFLQDESAANVRTTLVNFRKDGAPFINLLYMSKLRGPAGGPDYIFASQFDVSRAQVGWLRDYNRELGRTLDNVVPLLSETGMILGGTLSALADGAATIAQARMALAALESGR